MCQRQRKKNRSSQWQVFFGQPIISLSSFHWCPHIYWLRATSISLPLLTHWGLPHWPGGAGGQHKIIIFYVFLPFLSDICKYFLFTIPVNLVYIHVTHMLADHLCHLRGLRVQFNDGSGDQFNDLFSLLHTHFCVPCFMISLCFQRHACPSWSVINDPDSL